ncbi:ester cyclase [Kitasatospora sp. MMS16-BH015]|uniref:ester cyclase n=1 Tax=Kitasatospora sp. MMS16-BH015 TaxID=2018025 RepID=UPI000CA131CD|nr:ester cyclase [Kitasatospora sp. MMS16-BH015]AUG80227.1 ester cyclase [Kitasatospora sp. MMS16-BH015]
MSVTALATAPITTLDTTTLDTNKNVIREFVAALNDRSGERWVPLLSPGVIDHNKVIFGEEDAPGAAIEGFRLQLAAFSTEGEEDGFHIQQLIAEGEEVVARLRVTGVHTGAHARMPQPTGRRCDVEQIWIFTVRDGRIAEIRAVSDRLGMFIQLGWDWPTMD